jgi:ABC-2 type transport system ATP-binding protein
MEHAAAIQLENVIKRYDGVTAVDGLSLHVAPGEVYALLGPNGAGKTTTIRMLLGFAAADSGVVRAAGYTLPEQAPQARRTLAYIPEQVNLYGKLTGVENLDYFSRLAGKRHVRRELEEKLRQAGLDATAANQRVEQYSKGMRQKVGIAIALAKESKVLLLDEPTSGLDPAAANEFTARIREVAGLGVTVLMATHDIFRAHQVAQRVGVLTRGRLAAERHAAFVTLTELESEYLALAEKAA